MGRFFRSLPGSPVRLAGRPCRYVACLKRDAFAENHLLESPDSGKFVVKFARPLAFLARRERAIYRRLQGIEGIPRLAGPQGETWVAHEWVEGRTLASIWEEILRDAEARVKPIDPRVPPDFYERLEAIVRAIHARGVVVMDLAKRDNIIVRPDGRPALIDFQISLAFAPRAARRGPLGRRLFETFAAADLYQVSKHGRRHGLCAERERSAIHAFHRRFLRDAWLKIRRRWLPAGW